MPRTSTITYKGKKYMKVGVAMFTATEVSRAKARYYRMEQEKSLKKKNKKKK